MRLGLLAASCWLASGIVGDGVWAQTTGVSPDRPSSAGAPYPPPAHDQAAPNPPYAYPPTYDYPPAGYDMPGAPYPDALYAPAPESATRPVGPAPMPSEPTHAADVDYGVTVSSSVYSENDSTSLVASPLLEARYALPSRLAFALAWGFGWLVDNQGIGSSTFRAGSPALTASYGVHQGTWAWYTGIAVVPPVAHVPLGPDGRLYQSIYSRTLAAGGMWNQWLWLTDRLTVPLVAGVEHETDRGIRLSADAALAEAFGARAHAEGADVLGQLAIEASVPVLAHLAFRPRYQTVLLPKNSIDRWQSALALSGLWDTGHARYFLRVLLNLDEPLGALAGGPRWGFMLGKELAP
jgi:hypothetical protein